MVVLRSFWPQVGFLIPLAAFLCLGALWLWRGGDARGYGVCLALGAMLGLGLSARTEAQLARLQMAYNGRTVALVAEVESTATSYYEGVVSAVLRVERVNGRTASFRIECACLPKCDAGQLVAGRFALTVPDKVQRLNDYADGVAFSADDPDDFRILGRSETFRARTARLQRKLSEALRGGLAAEEGGVLAAMVVGDRKPLTTEMNSAYRAAGLSHVLVVSGMHVSILCGDLFRVRRSGKAGRREQSHLVRKARAVFRAVLALILVGVTGFTPSVLRAAVAVWIASLAVWIGGEPDALTSLALAGLLMTANNSFAACDVGFELSFAAVVGTLAGGECARLGAAWFAARQKERAPEQFPKEKTFAQKCRAKLLNGLWDTVCVSALASAATFPVLVLRGMSVSLYALVSSVAVLWLVTPLMLFGIAAALLGLVPFLALPQRACAWCAAVLTRVLDRWAVWVSGWPGAQIGFDTVCAALVSLLLLGLLWLAVQEHVRPGVAVPSILLAAVLSIGAGIALDRDVVRVELAGSRNSPAVVITQGRQAVVLFRGGASTQRSVETILSRRGVGEVAVLADLRLKPETACTLDAEKTISASRMDAYATQRAEGGDIDIEAFRTQNGCIVRVLAAGRQLVALSGTVELARPVTADWLLASPARPDAVRWHSILTLSDTYRWMDAGEEITPHTVLALRPGGGERVS